MFHNDVCDESDHYFITDSSYDGGQQIIFNVFKFVMLVSLVITATSMSKN